MNKIIVKENTKGITLVSLVVTIIVLIILAGVAINVTLGENGIFNKAKEAKRMQLEAEYKEKIGTDILAAQVDAIARNEELEDEQIKDIISNYGELQEDGDTIKIKYSDIEVSLTDIYKGTTTSNGSYTENKAKIELLEKQVEKLQKQLEQATTDGDSLNSILLKTNATEDKILKDYKAYSNGELMTGTMKNNGAIEKTLNAGENYNVPEGYTSGGTIKANSLESQTQATATESDITSGKTAWVNGNKVTGTMKTLGEVKDMGAIASESYSLTPKEIYSNKWSASNSRTYSYTATSNIIAFKFQFEAPANWRIIYSNEKY